MCLRSLVAGLFIYLLNYLFIESALLVKNPKRNKRIPFTKVLFLHTLKVQLLW